MRTGAGALARMCACGSEAKEHMCACRVRGHTCVCVCCVRSAGKVSGGRRAVRPVPHAGPALRSAGRTLAGVWRGRPCARGDAGRLAGRVAVRVVPRGLVLGREGACVGVRRVPSGARGGVAAEQVARGRAVVFFFGGNGDSLAITHFIRFAESSPTPYKIQGTRHPKIPRNLFAGAESSPIPPLLEIPKGGFSWPLHSLLVTLFFHGASRRWR